MLPIDSVKVDYIMLICIQFANIITHYTKAYGKRIIRAWLMTVSKPN